MPNFDAIFFDWDGTLADSLNLIVEAHNHVRRHFGLEPWEMVDYFGTASQSARDLYPKIYGDKAGEAITILYQFMGENHLESTAPLDGAEALVKELARFDIPLGVVSNKRHDVLLREVEHFGWGDYFSAVIGAGHAETDKPSAAPLLLGLKEAGYKGDMKNVLYVGDTETDLRCARAAGTQAALILHGRDMGGLIREFSPVIVEESVPGIHRALLA